MRALRIRCNVRYVLVTVQQCFYFEVLDWISCAIAFAETAQHTKRLNRVGLVSLLEKTANNWSRGAIDNDESLEEITPNKGAVSCSQHVA